MRRLAARVAAAAAAVALLAGGLAAQARADSARRDTIATAADTLPKHPPPAPPALPIDVSGVLFANFQTGGVRANRTQNRFDVERAYLIFRAPAGDRVSVRVTADVFQQRDSTRDGYYRGWTLRAKHAYMQWDYLAGTGDALRASARFGMLHTPIIDHEEQFWPRGLAQSSTELWGYFSSADLGAATLVTLPNRWGELYATVVNGSGYTSRETDRFKDVGARLTLTPLAHSSGILKTLAITPWGYKGARASDFVRQRGTVRAVGEGRDKDRYGLFAGIRDPRLVVGAHASWRGDVVETADTTVATAPTALDRRGRVLSAYTLVKPVALAGVAHPWPLVAVLRYDRFTPDDERDAYQQFVVAGLGWELSRKATVYADWQSTQPRNGSGSPDTKVFFIHAIVGFP